MNFETNILRYWIKYISVIQIYFSNNISFSRKITTLTKASIITSTSGISLKDISGIYHGLIIIYSFFWPATTSTSPQSTLASASLVVERLRPALAGKQRSLSPSFSHPLLFILLLWPSKCSPGWNWSVSVSSEWDNNLPRRPAVVVGSGGDLQLKDVDSVVNVASGPITSTWKCPIHNPHSNYQPLPIPYQPGHILGLQPHRCTRILSSFHCKLLLILFFPSPTRRPYVEPAAMMFADSPTSIGSTAVNMNFSKDIIMRFLGF